MLLYDAPVCVNHKQRGQRGDPAVLHAHLRRRQYHGIIDALGFDHLVERIVIIIVRQHPDDLQLVLISFL